MYSLLTVFKLRRLAFNQSFNPDKSLLILFSIMATSESPEVILVSSAYLLGIVYDRQPDKSFIKRRKRSGSSIEPCGTPHLMVRALDKTPFTKSLLTMGRPTLKDDERFRNGFVA